jgi:fluoride exporter
MAQRLKHAPSRPGSHRLRPAACAAVATGGIVGSLARYGVDVALPYRGHDFPWATLTVNVFGALCIGLLLSRLPAQPSLLRPLLVTGVLGGFTTMSTLVVDFVHLIERGDSPAAWLYLSITLVAGFVATSLGMRRSPDHVVEKIHAVEEIDVVEEGT